MAKLNYTFAITYGRNRLPTSQVVVEATTNKEAWQLLMQTAFPPGEITKVELLNARRQDKCN